MLGATIGKYVNYKSGILKAEYVKVVKAPNFKVIIPNEILSACMRIKADKFLFDIILMNFKEIGLEGGCRQV